MLEGITLGSYVPGNSILHNLDPRTKITGSLILIVGTLLAASPWSYLGYSLASLFILALSGLPLRVFLRGMHIIYLILLLSFLVQSFSVPGVPVFEMWGLTMTLQGVKSGILMCWRLAVIIVISSLVTYTTTALNLSAGLERLLSPLGRLGLPVDQLAMMMGITINFIPVMFVEFQSVMTAQHSRGAGFGDRNLFRQAKNLLPLMVPVIAGILRRADELSEAMEGRCYRPGAHRTRMKELRFNLVDWAALAGSFVLLAGVIVIEYGDGLF